MRLSELGEGHDRRSNEGRADAQQTKRKTVCELKLVGWEGQSKVLFGTSSQCTQDFRDQKCHSERQSLANRLNPSRSLRPVQREPSQCSPSNGSQPLSNQQHSPHPHCQEQRLERSVHVYCWMPGTMVDP